MSDAVRNHKKRYEFARCTKRFILNHSGRRSFKSETFKRKLVLHCMKNGGRYLAAAPTHKQAKRIFWEDLKKLTPKCRLGGRISESDLVIPFDTGAEILVAGLDAPDRVEGTPLHGALLDEYGNMAARVWPEVISPMLADTRGFGWFCGVPEGRNHYYDLIEHLKRDDDVAVFHWPSSDMMDSVEIERQKGLLDELTFAQEFGGEFVHFAGRAYYAFHEKIHCAPVRDLYDKRAPLVFCFDFNVDPGVSCVVQPRKLPNGLAGDAVIGEVFVPQNSNTEIVARQLAIDWTNHEGRIHLYGDFTGGARGSAKTRGSDWDIVQQILRASFGADRIHIDVPHNPAVRRRVNAVNSRLRAVNGDIRLMVDPKWASHVVKDLEGVTILEGTSGEIDKKSAPQLSHLCFTGDTVVETLAGMCRMDALPESGLVRGFDGVFVPYVGARKTGEGKSIISVSISDGSVVQCTPEHQWLTDRGWKCAKHLKGRLLIDCVSLSQGLIDKTSIAKNSTGMTARSVTSDAQAGRASSIYTAWCTRTFAGRFRKDFTSITSMAIERITRSIIWIVFRQSDTFKNMSATTQKGENARAQKAWSRQEKPQKHGTLVMRVVNGIASMHVWLLRMFSLAPSLSYASIVDVTSDRTTGMQNIAARTAKPARDITQSSITRLDSVLRAAEYSRRTNTQEHGIAADHALRVTSIKKEKRKADVYCLFVPGDGCFSLANGAIVSNSDALGYYLHRMYPPGLEKEAKIGNLY